MDLRTGKHPDEDTLEKRLLGSLDQNAANQIEEHLLLCHVCIENARKLDDYIKAMRKALMRKALETAVGGEFAYHPSA